MKTLGFSTLISQIAPLVLSYIEKGWTRQDSILKAMELTNTNRYLTPQERLELTEAIQARYPGMEDVLWYVNLAQQMFTPGEPIAYSSGSPAEAEQKAEQEAKIGAEGKSYVLYFVIALVALMVIKR